MTTLCAIHDPMNKCTWIGSDAQWTQGNRVQMGAHKWAMANGWAVAVSGDGRALMQVKQGIDLMTKNAENAHEIAERIRCVVIEDGSVHNQSEHGTKDFGSSYIIANKDGVWDCDSAFCCIPIDGFCARGSGGDYALGAGYAGLLDENLTIRRIITRAIATACDLDAYSNGMWTECLK